MLSRSLGAVAAVVLLAGCAIGVKTTQGMKLYETGDYAAARPKLEAEVQDGQVSASYALGMMYLNGQGVAVDRGQAERLLTDAAVAGDPRAVTAIRAMLAEDNLCPKDGELRGHWGNVGTMHRNLVTGVVELFSAPPPILQRMAHIYLDPCPGRQRQEKAARNLDALSRGPRTTYIYVPG